MYDYDDPEDLARALESAKAYAIGEVKDYMKENISAPREVSKSRYFIGARPPVDPDRITKVP